MPSIAKEIMIQEVTKQFEESPYAFISSFDKMNVEELSTLRRSLEKSGKRSLVVKHSFAKKVFKDKKFDGADQFLKGSVLVTFADKDPQVTSKALVTYSKKNEKLVPSGLIFESKIYDQSYIKQLASLPSREEILTQMVVRVKSPITGFVMTLGQMVKGLVVALNAVKEKKEASPQAA